MRGRRRSADDGGRVDSGHGGRKAVGAASVPSSRVGLLTAGLMRPLRVVHDGRGVHGGRGGGRDTRTRERDGERDLGHMLLGQSKAAQACEERCQERRRHAGPGLGVPATAEAWASSRGGWGQHRGTDDGGARRRNDAGSSRTAAGKPWATDGARVHELGCPKPPAQGVGVGCGVCPRRRLCCCYFWRRFRLAATTPSMIRH